MIRLCNNLLRFFHYTILLTMLSETILLGVATTGCASEAIRVTPMVRLQSGFTEQRVTGNILRDEWVKKKDDSGICWEGKLWTFYVFHSIGSSKLSCMKNGIFIPHNACNGENPKVVIDASCGRETKHPPAIVRICQRHRPGDLKFDFHEKTLPQGGSSLTLKAEHFVLNNHASRSLHAILQNINGKKILYFLLNYEEEKEKEKLRSDTLAQSSQISSANINELNSFFPLLGRDLFVETYSDDTNPPSGRGVIWPDPRNPLNWVDAQQPPPHHINLHSALGVMRCMSAEGLAWKNLYLANCFDKVKLPAGMDDHHIFLTFKQKAQDPSTVIKSYQGGEKEKIIQLPRITSGRWEVKDLRLASPLSGTFPTREATTVRYNLDDFVKPGTYPVASEQKQRVFTVKFTAPYQTVLEVNNSRTEAVQILVFDERNEQALQFHAGEYQLHAYLEGHDVFNGSLSIEPISKNYLVPRITFNSNDYTGSPKIKIDLKRTKFIDTRSPIIIDLSKNQFIAHSGVPLTNFYVRFNHEGFSEPKFDIPVSAKLNSISALTNYRNILLHDDTQRFQFPNQTNNTTILPLHSLLQPPQVAVTVSLREIHQSSFVQNNFYDGDWSPPIKAEERYTAWIPTENSGYDSPATIAFNIRACTADSRMLYSASVPSQLLPDVLGGPINPNWQLTPVPENTLVFLSGDSATSNSKLETDKKDFFKSAAKAMQEHQRRQQSINEATVVYGMGVDGQFRQYQPGKVEVLPTEYGGMQNLDQALSSALSSLSFTARTAGQNDNPCGTTFRLIYFGYAPSLSTSKVPETFNRVDVVTPAEENPSQFLQSSRFKVSVVDSEQSIIDRLDTLLPVEKDGGDKNGN